MIEYHRESTYVEIGFTDDHSLFPLSPRDTPESVSFLNHGLMIGGSFISLSNVWLLQKFAPLPDKECGGQLKHAPVNILFFFSFNSRWELKAKNEIKPEADPPFRRVELARVFQDEAEKRTQCATPHFRRVW